MSQRTGMIVAAGILAALCGNGATRGEEETHLPKIEGSKILPFQAEYSSSAGSRFTLTVRKAAWVDGSKMLATLIELEASENVLIDDVGLSAASLELVYQHAPFFALGMDYLVAWRGRDHLDATLLPIGGGEPAYRKVPVAGAVYEAGRFGLVLGAMDLKEGMEFELPFLIGKQAGRTFGTSVARFEVQGRESIRTGSPAKPWETVRVAVSNELLGPETWWVSPQPPYWIKRESARSTSQVVRLIDGPRP